MEWLLVCGLFVKCCTNFKQKQALSSNNCNAISGQFKNECNWMKSSYSIGKSTFLQLAFILTLLYKLITVYCSNFDCNITNLPPASVAGGKKIKKTFFFIRFIFKQSVLLFHCILPLWEVSQLFALPQSLAGSLVFG